jgi:long-chain fatty acid transport protein
MGFEDDSADLNLMGTQLSMGSTVTIPAPAVLALSASYDIMDNLTVEFTFDRTFWSEYDQLNFDYDVTIPGNIFDVPVSKDWDDANAYRLSVTYGVTKSLDVMLGFAYDESPISTSHVGFELPDSDAYLFSLGFQYAVSDNLDLGLSMLYDYKTDRTVENNYTDTVYGEFTGSYGLLVSCGLNYRF